MRVNEYMMLNDAKKLADLMDKVPKEAWPRGLAHNVSGPMGVSWSEILTESQRREIHPKTAELACIGSMLMYLEESVSHHILIMPSRLIDPGIAVYDGDKPLSSGTIPVEVLAFACIAAYEEWNSLNKE